MRLVNHLLLTFITIAITFYCQAGGENPPSGGRSYGLGNASVALKDPFALFNNIAGISSEENISFFTSAQLPYGITALKRIAAGAVLKYKDLAWGMSLYNFGDHTYGELKAGIGIAHQIRQVSLGLKINYSQISIAETGVLRNIIAEFGGTTEVSRYVRFGAHIYNLNLAKTGIGKKELIPVIMKAGFSFQPSRYLVINIETEKSTNLPHYLKGGIEYFIGKKFPVRMGITTGPLIYYFGTGVQGAKLAIDYGISSHPQLGLTHTLSISLKVRKKYGKV